MLMILKTHKKCLEAIFAGVDSSYLAAFMYSGWRSRVQKKTVALYFLPRPVRKKNTDRSDKTDVLSKELF